MRLMFLGTRHVPSPKTTFNLASVLHRAGTKRKAIVEGPNKLHEFWLRSARDVLDALPSYALSCGYYHECPLPVETVVATPLLHRRQTARFEGDDRTDVPGPLRSDDKRCKAPKKNRHSNKVQRAHPKIQLRRWGLGWRDRPPCRDPSK